MSASIARAVQRPQEALAAPTLVLRLLLTILGSALAFSAFGLWLVPGAANMPELSLIKLGLSLFMLICGMCCLVFARKDS